MNPPSLQFRPLPRSAARFVAPLCALLSAISTAYPAGVSPKSIRPERELFITAPAVVDSDAAIYPGPWSFGTLICELAGDEDASDCVADWLAQWRGSQTANGQVIMPRSRIDDLVVKPWQARDGYDAKSGQPWKPNLAHAPFRLLAIVNRLDLSAPSAAGTFQNVKMFGRCMDSMPSFNVSPAPPGSVPAIPDRRPIPARAD